MSLSSACSKVVIFLYYDSSILRSGPNDIGRVITLEISAFADLAGVQFVFRAAEGATSDYFDGLLLFEHVGNGMLFQFPTVLVNLLSYFWFHKVAERILMDPVLVALLFCRLTEIHWSSSGRSDDLFLTTSSRALYKNTRLRGLRQ